MTLDDKNMNVVCHCVWVKLTMELQQKMHAAMNLVSKWECYYRQVTRLTASATKTLELRRYYTTKGGSA